LPSPEKEKEESPRAKLMKMLAKAFSKKLIKNKTS